MWQRNVIEGDDWKYNIVSDYPFPQPIENQALEYQRDS